MKSLDEAVNAVVRVIPPHSPEAVHEEAERWRHDVRGRLHDVLVEAISHPLVKIALDNLAEEACCARHGLGSAFLLGLQIGMEMERSETGGIAE